jgi:hypothetical protein
MLVTGDLHFNYSTSEGYNDIKITFYINYDTLIPKLNTKDFHHIIFFCVDFLNRNNAVSLLCSLLVFLKYILLTIIWKNNVLLLNKI